MAHQLSQMKIFIFSSNEDFIDQAEKLVIKLLPKVDIKPIPSRRDLSGLSFDNAQAFFVIDGDNFSGVGWQDSHQELLAICTEAVQGISAFFDSDFPDNKDQVRFFKKPINLGDLDSFFSRNGPDLVDLSLVQELGLELDTKSDSANESDSSEGEPEEHDEAVGMEMIADMKLSQVECESFLQVVVLDNTAIDAFIYIGQRLNGILGTLGFFESNEATEALKKVCEMVDILSRTYVGNSGSIIDPVHQDFVNESIQLTGAIMTRMTEGLSISPQMVDKVKELESLYTSFLSGEEKESKTQDDVDDLLDEFGM